MVKKLFIINFDPNKHLIDNLPQIGDTFAKISLLERQTAVNSLLDFFTQSSLHTLT